MFVIIILVFSYLSGSIPFGVIFVKFFGNDCDLRNVGSGNIGATNVMRTQDKKWIGVITFLCDFLKSAIPCFIAKYYSLDYLFISLCALLTVIGHIYPIWINFKGGKGVATTLGVFLATMPTVFVIAVIVWLLIFFVMRISSISGLSAIWSGTLISYIVTDSYELLITYLLIAVLVSIKHSGNIKNLLENKELIFGGSKKK